MSPSPEKLARREQRQLERWEKLTAVNSSWGEKWRSPARTRILIYSYYVSLAVATLAMLAMMFLPPGSVVLVIIFCLSLVVGAVVWTMLRTAIEMKDTAPLAALDEYEASIVAHWHTVSSRLIGWLLLGYALTILLVAMWRGHSMTALNFGLPVALGLILITLLFTSLPAVGYALTFHTRDED